jgi:hypothetical protein
MLMEAEGNSRTQKVTTQTQSQRKQHYTLVSGYGMTPTWNTGVVNFSVLIQYCTLVAGYCVGLTHSWNRTGIMWI